MGFATVRVLIDSSARRRHVLTFSKTVLISHTARCVMAKKSDGVARRGARECNVRSCCRVCKHVVYVLIRVGAGTTRRRRAQVEAERALVSWR